MNIKNYLFIIFLTIFLMTSFIFYTISLNKSSIDGVSERNIDENSINTLILLRAKYAENIEIINENYKFAEFVGNILGKKININVAKDNDLIKIIKSGKPDILWTSTEHYLENQDVYKEYSMILRPCTGGSDRYRGIIITNSDNININSVKDLKGQIFGFTHVNSASGYKLPMKLFKEKYGIDIYNFFKDIKFLDNHQSVIESVYYNKIAAGAVFENAISIYMSGREKSIKIIEHTPYILNEPIFVKKELLKVFDEKTINKIINNTPDNVLETLKLTGFVKAEPEDYL